MNTVFNVNEINTRTINRKELLALLNTNEQKMFKAFVKSVVGWLMIKFKMNTKPNQVYTSTLGKMYAEKQGLRDINNIAESVYQSFEFFIKCGETLPIIASPVELDITERFEMKDMENILSFLKEKGCIVNYKFEDCNHKFTLVELLWGKLWNYTC